MYSAYLIQTSKPSFPVQQTLPTPCSIFKTVLSTGFKVHRLHLGTEKEEEGGREIVSVRDLG